MKLPDVAASKTRTEASHSGPDGQCVAPTPDPSFTQEALRDAKALRKLLNLEKGVCPNTESHAYNGPRRFLREEDIAGHLAGDPVLGFVAGHKGRTANFLCFDCDQNFPTRLAILREVLRGGLGFLNRDRHPVV